jgi:hypothetical protein
LGLIVVALTLAAMSGPVLVRRRVHLDRLRVNNEVAGFKFATLGVLYAVLLAFAVIVVWEKLSDAERTVSKEGGALATLYRLSGGLDDEPRQNLRQALSEYANLAIREEWPAMEYGRSSAQVTGALDHLYSNVLPMHPSDQRGAVIMREILQQLDLITQARRDRLISAKGTVPDVMWAVLLCGGILTIGFTFFFGTQNVIAQGLMTGALSFLIFSSLLLIVAIDQPFAGPVQVQPDALFAAQEEFAKQTGS